MKNLTRQGVRDLNNVKPTERNPKVIGHIGDVKRCAAFGHVWGPWEDIFGGYLLKATCLHCPEVTTHDRFEGSF